MQANAELPEGRAVWFVVERRLHGTVDAWETVAIAESKVEGGAVQASASLAHAFAGTDDANVSVPQRVRFRLSLVKPKLAVKPPPPAPKVERELANLRWGPPHAASSRSATMLVDAAGYADGARVAFVVQAKEGASSWRDFATVPAVVRDGAARAALTTRRGDERAPVLRFNVTADGAEKVAPSAELSPALAGEPTADPSVAVA